MKKRVLITGANGYIGKYLLKRLLKEDYQLVALVRDLGKMPSWLLGSEKLTLIEGDLLDKTSLKKATEGVDIIFHLAASLRMFERDNELHQTNVVGLKNILNAAKRANRPIHFIFASTIDAINPVSDYGRSKSEGEKIVKKICQRNPKLSFTILRIGNVYGGKEEGMVGMVKEVLGWNNWRSSILFHTFGKQKLHLIEVNDLVQKLVGLITDQRSKNKTSLLVDEELTVKQLAIRLKKQKLISQYPSRLPFEQTFLKIWQLLGRISKRADLLIYLSLGK